jgi:hypothetical protein
MIWGVPIPAYKSIRDALSTRLVGKLLSIGRLTDGNEASTTEMGDSRTSTKSRCRRTNVPTNETAVTWKNRFVPGLLRRNLDRQRRNMQLRTFRVLPSSTCRYLRKSTFVSTADGTTTRLSWPHDSMIEDGRRQNPEGGFR